MSLRPFRDIHRKKTKVINVGDVKIGGDNPIAVQSMTNTLTTDIQATIKQINNIYVETHASNNIFVLSKIGASGLKHISDDSNVCPNGR